MLVRYCTLAAMVYQIHTQMSFLERLFYFLLGKETYILDPCLLISTWTNACEH